MMYAYMTSQAEQALAQWPPSRVHRIRYEDLVAAPGEELIRLGDFLNFAEPARWAADVAGRIRAPSSTRTLGGRARDERR
jgi:putative sulfotransferase